MDKNQVIKKVNALKSQLDDHVKGDHIYISDKKADDIFTDFDNIIQDAEDLDDPVGDQEDELGISSTDEADRLDDDIDIGNLSRDDLIHLYGDDYKYNIKKLRELHEKGFQFFMFDRYVDEISAIPPAVVYMIIDDFDYNDYFDEV